ncbi:hypothetical protein A9Q79_08240 [Methylophaga sp. 42_25_T18]|nr:hypothetical protein A9Q79_08240 [Methylophaga sp. 42_25_T18]
MYLFRYKIRFTFFTLLSFFLISGISFAHHADSASSPVKIQLKWYHQFQFAGYYAALEQGYFEQAGLNVELIEGSPTRNPSEEVLNGNADFSIGNSTLIMEYAQGKPLVSVAAIYQRSPLVIFAKRNEQIKSISDLAGKTLMIEEHAAELFAYMTLAGVNTQAINMVAHEGSILALDADNPNSIDAMSAYSSNEPFQAIQADIDYRVFSPRDLGINMYGDTLFTHAAFAKEHPEIVRDVRDAVIRGWQYALKNQEEMVSLIMDNYAPQLSAARLNYEANEINELIANDFIELGYQNKKRWQHINDVFASAGMMPPNYSLEEFLFENSDTISPWVYQSLIWVSVVTLIAVLLANRFYLLNRKLTQEIINREELQQELMRLVGTDPLSNLANRRKLEKKAKEEISRCQRYEHDLALILFDLNLFKSINDLWGHACGDRCITTVSQLCEFMIRESDLAARIGGDEFAVLLPEISREAAELTLERIRQAILEADLFNDHGENISLSASFGLAMLSGSDDTFDSMLSRADKAMYREKHASRKM